ncbi:hypothetical protein Adi01nite_00170 [Amorphoplanes digitatis]|uniref:Uncharacterized protein n=1 Tax=Actinoplanes digitatis TaxID=1868 RepID=A0A7W7MPA8_9ACTN|nr:hypothetical protein [Actinoplanes digitatis]MBB4761497.1 hypothetical protein [Actinoplanes digitatis]GID90605.1 hypothetical protein Adi01nite_00170 [Actinoplanes digitatis]
MTGNPDNEDASNERDRDRTVIVVGLLATPPDYPARVAQRLAAELAGLLDERVNDHVRWEVQTGWGSIAPRRDGGVEALLADVARRREQDGWDVAICLTDLPLQAQRVPIVVQSSAARRVAVVSLPALGLGQLRAVRAVVPGMVKQLLHRPGTGHAPGDPEPLKQLVDVMAAIHRILDDSENGEIGLVASRVRGGLRLVIGMVRANRPGRALLGLSKLLVVAFGTAAFALTTDTIWQMGDALSVLRLTVIMLFGIGSLIAWLIVAHDLWERPGHGTPPELARLFNIGTVLTLCLATAVSYVVLFAGTVAAAWLLIRPSVLEQSLQPPIGLTDYLTLAWIVSSLATVGGAIGSGLEDEETVRAAAYGYHPDPGGWLDETGGSDTEGSDQRGQTDGPGLPEDRGLPQGRGWPDGTGQPDERERPSGR